MPTARALADELTRWLKTGAVLAGAPKRWRPF
jgi:hypothetical protein